MLFSYFDSNCLFFRNIQKGSSACLSYLEDERKHHDVHYAVAYTQELEKRKIFRPS
jgi:hypothetical protein